MHKRWIATITYHTENGPKEVKHHIEEIEDLQDHVEIGPHWDSIIDIKIIRNPATLTEALTVEAYAKR